MDSKVNESTQKTKEEVVPFQALFRVRIPKGFMVQHQNTGGETITYDPFPSSDDD